MNDEKLEKLAKKHLQSLIDVKYYKKFKEFLEEDKSNEVHITLKPEGLIIIVKKHNNIEEPPVILNYKNWIDIDGQ